MADIKFNHENWIGSEESMVLKTATINSTNAVTTETETDASGASHTIARSGSVFADSTTGIYGLIYQDIDITNGDRLGSVMVAGHYIAKKLPASVDSGNEEKFAKQGLFPIIESDAVRPEWASAE